MRGDDLLTLLLYGLDIATRPTLGNMVQSGESWQRYQGLHSSQLHKLRNKGLVERHGDKGHWALSLTEPGRLRVLGGRDPEERWGRNWDGKWRMLMFDLEVGNESLRRRLLRWLHEAHFGCLQKSVWLLPDPCSGISETLEQAGAPAGAVLFFEGRPAMAGMSDPAIAAGAWDFEAINANYEAYRTFVSDGVPKKLNPLAARQWTETEAHLWGRAAQFDPMLPDVLLPGNYLGKKAWGDRQRLFRKASDLTVALDDTSG